LTKQSEEVAHNDLVNGSQTDLHSHTGGSGGLIDKSGVETTDGNGEAIVTFNTNYPNTNYAILLGGIHNDGLLIYVKSGTKTISGFTLISENDKGQKVSVTVFWATCPYSNP